MEAATKATGKAAATTPKDRDFALRLGSLLAHVMSLGGVGDVIRALDATGLSFVQMKTLITIGAAGTEQISVKHVAEKLGVSLPSASRAVDGLVRKDLATRVEDPDDRRVRRIALTAQGQEVVDEILASRLEGLERYVAELTPTERRKLDAALEVLLERDELAQIYRAHRKRTSS